MTSLERRRGLWPSKISRWGLLSLEVLLATAGCGSRFVATSIVNKTDHPLQMIELDYPGASFGVSTLAPHGVYSYRFKAIGSGPLSLTYTEAGVSHTATGPVVNDGKGGRMDVSIREHGAVSWGLATPAR